MNAEEMAEYVRKLVDEAPPLSTCQRVRLAFVLDQGSADSERSQEKGRLFLEHLDAGCCSRFDLDAL